MRRLYLRDCVAGDIIEDVYVVSGKQFSPTSNGKFFIKAFVSDRSSQVTARIWGASREMFNAMPDAGFLRIRARIENYQSNLQCIIENFWPAPEGSYDIGDLLPQTTKDIGEMARKVAALLAGVRNRHLAALLQAYLDDEAMMTDFRKAPAAMSFHHAYVGGLLEHTLNAMEVAEAVAPFYPGLNRDIVLAGIFLHDIAKTWELQYETAFGYTDGGQLIGHIVKSVLWVEKKRAEAEKALGEPIPQPLIDVIQHIILSHHDKPEFGSPKTPATPEAIFVHMIENLDAKMMMSLGATRGENVAAASEGNWTEFMKAFGGRLYRPDVAPGEGDERPREPVAPATPVRAAPRAESPRPAPSGSGQAKPPGAKAADVPPSKMEITNPLFATMTDKRGS